MRHDFYIMDVFMHIDVKHYQFISQYDMFVTLGSEPDLFEMLQVEGLIINDVHQ